MSDTITNILTRLGIIGVAKGATAAAQATVTTVDADHNALDVSVRGTPALAADAATATLQGTGNTSLASILAKIIAAPATEAKQDTGNTSAATTATNTGTIAGAVNSAAMVVKGAGTAGTAASAVLTIQGIASMTPVAVSDNSSSLTVDAPVGTPVFVRLSDGAAAVSPALDATLTGGAQIAIAKGAAASGAAVSGNPVLTAGSDGTNARTIATDTSGRTVAVGAAATGAAVAGSPVYIAGIDGGGLARPLLVSAAGNMQTAPAKGTTVSSSAAEASHVISASACLVAKIRGYNGNAGVRYFQGHNASSLPGNGAVPSVVSEQATSAHAQEVNFALPTDRFSTGCVVATSSTGATLTIGSADATFTVDLFPANV